METGEKGHFLFDFLADYENVNFVDIKDAKCSKQLEEVMVSLSDQMKRTRFLTPEPKYFVIFADMEKLSTVSLKSNKHGYVTECSMPEYDLRLREHREYLLDKIKKDKPQHVFMTPPCTMWSSR